MPVILNIFTNLHNAFLADSLRIASVFPTKVSEEGHRSLIVSGSGFMRNDDLACVFGEDAKTVPASWIHPTMLKCDAPALPLGNVTLRVTNNMQDFSENDVSIIYSGKCFIFFLEGWKKFFSLTFFCYQVLQR